MKNYDHILKFMTKFFSRIKNFAWIIMLGISESALAIEVPEHYTPIRPVGMGGAFTAVANDENALWTNPAGIARVRKAKSRKNNTLITIPNLNLGLNANAKQFMTTSSTSEDVADQVSSSDVSDEKPIWVSFSAAPAILANPGSLPISFAAFTNARMKIVPQSDDPSISDLKSINDVGGLLGFALTSKNNRFNFGVQGRYILRNSVETTITTTSLSDKTSLKSQLTNLSNQSTAFAVDTGFMATLADFWFPTVGISILNAPLGCQNDYLNPFTQKRQVICGTKFTGTILNPDDLSTLDPTDIRFGASITPRFSRNWAMRFAVDIQNMALGSESAYYGLPGIEALKLLHAGAELFAGNPLTPSPFSLRAGLGQGYISFGATLKLGALALEGTSYGRDISNTSTGREDRRYQAGFSIEF